jgi:hypothetical protein
MVHEAFESVRVTVNPVYHVTSIAGTKGTNALWVKIRMRRQNILYSCEAVVVRFSTPVACPYAKQTVSRCVQYNVDILINSAPLMLSQKSCP